MKTDDIFFKNLSYKYKFSIMFILFGIVLTMLSGLIIYVAEKNSLENDFLKNVEYEMAGKENSVKWFLRDIQNSLNILASHSKDPKKMARDAYINTFLDITANIAGIVLIKEGRVDKRYGKSAFINRKLADFAATAHTVPGGGVNVLDTFADEGAPRSSFMVLSSESPLFDGQMMLVAVNMDSLINFISKSHFSDLSIIDAEGNYLIYKDGIEPHGKRVGFYERYPENGEDIMYSDIYVGEGTYAKKVRFSNREFLVMLEMDSQILEEKKATLYKYGAVIFGIILIISLPLSYLFSILPDRLNRKISEQKNLFETLSKHSLAGVFLYQSRFLYTNPHFSEFTGYGPDETKGLSIEDLFTEETHRFGESYTETRIVTKTGEEKWMYVGMSGTTIDNKDALIGTLIDITELKKIQKELEHSATTDKLTGLMNRAKFEESFEAMRLDNAQHLYLAFFDIDHFKRINDTYGHNRGDEVLKALAAILKEELEAAGALIFRWGGEEFIALVHQSDTAAFIALAEKIRTTVEAYPFEEVGQVTVSIGLTGYREKESMQGMINRADEALYRAKDSGRNQVVADV